MDKQKLIQRLKEIGVVENRQVTLKNAGESTIYVDIKKAYGYPDILREITYLMHEKIDKTTTVVAAQGFGAIPLATALSKDYGYKLTLVREKPKNHGLKNLLEGYIPNKDDKVFIVDDVYSTGDSIRDVLEALEPTLAEITGCGVVVARDHMGLGLHQYNLMTLEELLKQSKKCD